MKFETLLYEVDDRVAVITFNRPERMNAFSLPLIKEVKEAVSGRGQGSGGARHRRHGNRRQGILIRL